ncbi:hypothetical protein C9374_012839 [Naegleria lovaniensis]|uniref:Uncharacterized protein n=1 Tax=Naegleria lovaniensis TaxID=51637 RepID=A0AA88GCI6_NAELO|nr:uncharacterized protein C9374_012839 [Naegleria lovaniensis]KAG2373107.1 hypothetical protein C9374_012839 [Naegleria lovaniensis]
MNSNVELDTIRHQFSNDYCCFSSPEHINYIVIGEFERACHTFAMLSDAEYKAPTIHTLLFNLNIPGIEVLLTKEFKLKQYSNNDIVEFDKLEQQRNRTHQPHNLLQISKTNNPTHISLLEELPITNNKLKNQKQMTLNSEYLSIGDYVLQLDEKYHVYICQIKQIKQWTKRNKKNKNLCLDGRF